MEMNDNISELLQALDQAKANVPQDWDYISNDESIMCQVLEMEYQVKPLSQQIGVSKDLLPAANELEDDEINMIVEKIIDVWAAYHYYADLPNGLPIRIAYDTLLSVWEEPVSCFPFGNFHFDFYNMELDQYINQEKSE